MGTCPFVGPLILLFWTFGDVSSGFQSQSGQSYSRLVEAYVIYMVRFLVVSKETISYGKHRLIGENLVKSPQFTLKMLTRCEVKGGRDVN